MYDFLMLLWQIFVTGMVIISLIAIYVSTYKVVERRINGKDEN